MNFAKSRCRGPYLHKFVTICSTEDGVGERCVKCGQTHVIKLVNGQPNITEYARWHMREFLVPQHRLFQKEYATR